MLNFALRGDRACVLFMVLRHYVQLFAATSSVLFVIKLTNKI